MGANNCKGFLPISSKVSPSKSANSGTPAKHDYIEGVVCKEDEIKDNEMKMLPLGDDGAKVLLIKQKGELHAIGTKCTHYGALLHTGALGEGRVRCPWHGACFNIKTGDIEDHPGLDSLPCYQVRVDEAGLVRVKAKRKDLELNRRLKDMCKLDANNVATVAIVGGGPAGATCAQTLRQEGFTGQIVMVCKEDVVPYDRVKVSKAMDFDVDKAALRPLSFYNEHKIDLKLGVQAIGLKADENILVLSTNEQLPYNYLFICTGSKPRVPDIPEVGLKNIFYMRDYTDGHAIQPMLEYDKHVVCLGLGFIGLEAAAYCVGKCASVTVIGRDSVPFRPVFGEDIGRRIKLEFEQKGIKFVPENSIAKFIPKETATGKLTNMVGSVELTDGTVLPADVAIIGIGSTFYTDWLKDSSLELREDGSIGVDKHLATNVANIFAGGDIAYAPIFGSDDKSAAIGHFALAHYHGRTAALNICGKETPLNSVPFFWTTLFGKSYRYAGHGRAEKVQIHGSLENLEFFAYYIQQGKIIAMSSCGADPIVSDFANLLHSGKSLTEEEITADPFDWIQNKPKDLQERFGGDVVVANM